MTEPISDALFGVDGTELPPVSPDPSGRGGWRDSTVLPSSPLPAMPNLNMTREQIAATLGEDPSPPADQAPPPPAAAPPNGTHPAAAPPAAALAPEPVPQERKPPASPSQPVITAVPSVQPTSSRPHLRPSLANGSFPRVHLRDPRRRFGRISRGLPAQSRSNGGAGAFFVIMLITFAVLLYFIITGIVDSFLGLIP